MSTMNSRGYVLLAFGICCLLIVGMASAYSPALEVTHEYSDHGGTLVDVEYDSQYDLVLSLDENGTFIAYQVWNEEIGLSTDQFSTGHALAVGDGAVYIAEANTLWEYDVEEGNLSELGTLDEHPGAMAYDSQRNVIWTTGLETVYGYNADDGSEFMSYSPHSDGIETIDVKDNYIATGTTWQPELVVYNVEQEEVVLQPELSQVGGVTATHLTDTGDVVIGTRGDGADDLIATYDIESGNQLLAYRTHIFGVSHVEYEPTTETIISTGGDNTVKFYDVNEETVFEEYQHQDTIYTADLDARNNLLWFGDGEERVGTVTGLNIGNTEASGTDTEVTTEGETDTTEDLGTVTQTDAEDGTGSDEQPPTETEGPGFGIIVGLSAAMVVALLARRIQV